MLTALIISSKKGNIEAVNELIKKGVNIKAKNNTALIEASKHGHIEIVKLLINNGANVKAQNHQAIQLACEYNHMEIVKFLVDQGSFLTANNNKSIQLASKRGNLEIVKYLIENGANVYSNNQMPIQLATEKGRLETVKYIFNIYKHENKNISDTIIDKKLLILAIKSGCFELVEYLLTEIDANLNREVFQCVINLAFESAASCRNLEIVKHLIKLGADIRFNNYHTLKKSLEKSNINVINFIIEYYNEDILNDEYVQKIFIQAFKMYLIKGKFDMIRYLMEKPINFIDYITIIKSNFYYYIRILFEKQYLEIAEYLIKYLLISCNTKNITHFKWEIKLAFHSTPNHLQIISNIIEKI
ncbi:ankyrin repeat protein [Megavirus chiliensis]|uniref:Ankyrin repeat protein n=2 Tax=Megamimivirinae TaxID=3044648 RepID=A0A2L2DNM1_MIMIV|nr:putative ankyrin repeat protein [Megavirus chiliensis]AEQ32963.1 ankyrin repeat protein [Megavirus chiliensis]AVG47768.1 ankyrin repeat protein [Acanthamoeba polyphaga mimivirus]